MKLPPTQYIAIVGDGVGKQGIAISSGVHRRPVLLELCNDSICVCACVCMRVSLSECVCVSLS